MATREKVIIRKCGAYDTDKIRGIINEGMQELGVKPEGNVLIKPNAVISHPRIFKYASTSYEVLDAALSATKENAGHMDSLYVGERSGLTMPTRCAFRFAGFTDVLKKHGVKPRYFDEEKSVPFQLKHPDALREEIFVPRAISEANFLINLPRLKAHPWTRLTMSLKNFIGIQDDAHRIIDHNQFLEHKIADLQEVIQPRFIAMDAIIAGQNFMVSCKPFHIGALVMGNNSCAVDTVGCHMVNVKPEELVHLKYASERGYGPMDLEDVEILGDYPLEEIQAKTKDFEFEQTRIDEYFEGSNVICDVGSFPEKHSSDYCWGGMPGCGS